MWPCLIKIQYTELKLSCGNDPVVKNSIYSNGDLNLWPNDPKIIRVLPLPQGNHVAKFGKDPIYRTKVIVRKPVWTPARLPYPITECLILYEGKDTMFVKSKRQLASALNLEWLLKPIARQNVPTRQPISVPAFYTLVSLRAVLCDWVWWIVLTTSESPF
jgi:hypothetical protein